MLAYSCYLKLHLIVKIDIKKWWLAYFSLNLDQVAHLGSWSALVTINTLVNKGKVVKVIAAQVDRFLKKTQERVHSSVFTSSVSNHSLFGWLHKRMQHLPLQFIHPPGRALTDDEKSHNGEGDEQICSRRLMSSAGKKSAFTLAFRIVKIL